MNVFAILDGSATYDWGNSAIAAVVSIVLVFVVLLIIIGITYLIFKMLGLFEMKKELDQAKAEKTATPISNNEGSAVKFDENDEDMVAAVLVATIDYQNEIKKDVKLVSIKEIK